MIWLVLNLQPHLRSLPQPPIPHHSSTMLKSLCSSNTPNCPCSSSVTSPNSHVAFSLSFLRSLLNTTYRTVPDHLHKVVPPRLLWSHYPILPYIGHTMCWFIYLLILCLLPENMRASWGKTLVWMDAATGYPPVPAHCQTHDGRSLNICLIN